MCSHYSVDVDFYFDTNMDSTYVKKYYTLVCFQSQDHSRST